MNERGYNQSALIARSIAEHFNVAYSENILLKAHNTKKQSILRGAVRLDNVHNSFICESDLSGMRVLVFDDIFTTGSTLNEAARTLKAAGASDIVGITAAIVK